LVGELRAIRVDRSEQNRHQLEDEARLSQQFAGVRKIQDQDFQQTAAKLETAIGGIKSMLITANQTLTQTEPIGIIRQERVEFNWCALGSWAQCILGRTRVSICPNSKLAEFTGCCHQA
jgi:hypothetical protein